jgi:hypothetical protein
MAELTIYDSEGSPIAETGARTNERIQDFFFDGVRLSVDTTGQGLEMVTFFRARDSQASRSEQYYAVFQSDDITDISRFGRMVSRRVEDELDKTFETSTDDTEMFRALRSAGADDATPPGAPNTRSDLVELVKEGTKVTVGVRTGEQARALIEEILREQRRIKAAVAERPDSSSLRDYDLVVDIGQYQGLALLGDTEQALEDLRERRRQRLQPDYVEDDEERDPVALAALGVAVVGGLLLLVYAGCWVMGSLPVVGGLPLPGADCGGAGSAGGGQVTVEYTYSANVTGAEWGNTSVNTTTLELQGALTNATNRTVTDVTNGTAPAAPSQNVTVRIVSQQGSWTNETTVPADENVTVTFENVAREPVSATLIWGNLTATASIDANGNLSSVESANRTVTRTFNTSESANGTDTTGSETTTAPTSGTETSTSTSTTAGTTTTATPTATTPETTQGTVSAVAAGLPRSDG